MLCLRLYHDILVEKEVRMEMIVGITSLIIGFSGLILCGAMFLWHWAFGGKNGFKIVYGCLFSLMLGLAILGGVMVSKVVIIEEQRQGICESIGGAYAVGDCYKDAKKVDLDEARQD